MLIVRGVVAFLFGSIALKEPEMSATSVAAVWGVWALFDGAATARQSFTAGASPGDRAYLLAMGAGSLAVLWGVAYVLVGRDALRPVLPTVGGHAPLMAH